jgi:hypothetical protein
MLARTLWKSSLTFYSSGADRKKNAVKRTRTKTLSGGIRSMETAKDCVPYSVN